MISSTAGGPTIEVQHAEEVAQHRERQRLEGRRRANIIAILVPALLRPQMHCGRKDQPHREHARGGGRDRDQKCLRNVLDPRLRECLQRQRRGQAGQAGAGRIHCDERPRPGPQLREIDAA